MPGPIIDTYSLEQRQGKQMVTGSYRRNRARLERLIKEDPRMEYYLALAHLEARNQYWDRAQEAVETALEREPVHQEAQLLLAQILEAKNELQQSEVIYQAVLNCHPQFSRGHREYARYLMTHTDSITTAQNLLLRSLDLDPRDALAHTLLAEVYLLKGRNGQALLHLELAAHYHEGQQPFYHQRTAKVFMKMEQYDEAARQLKLALRVDPKNKLIRSQYTQFRQVMKATNTSKFSFPWKR